MTVRVKVIPRSARTEFVGAMADGTLKVRVAAPPEQGKANEKLCAFLAKHFGVPRNSVKVLSGQTASLKLVRVQGVKKHCRVSRDGPADRAEFWRQPT